MITFVGSNSDRIPEPARAQIENMLRQAIQAARPEHERWRVTMREIGGGGARIYDFARDGDAPYSMTLSDVDDPDYTTLFRAASYFLRTQWPGALPLA